MPTHEPQPQPQPEPFFDDWPGRATFSEAEQQRLLDIADVRLYARLEAGANACSLVVEAISVKLEERVIERREYLKSLEDKSYPVLGPEPEKKPAELPLGDDARPAVTEAPEKKPVRIRTGILSLASLLHRTAENVKEYAHLLHALEVDLAKRGIDVHCENYRRRITDMFDEYVREIGFDSKTADEFAIFRLHDGLSRIEQVVDDARARVEASFYRRGWPGILNESGLSKGTVPAHRSEATMRRADCPPNLENKSPKRERGQGSQTGDSPIFAKGGKNWDSPRRGHLAKPDNALANASGSCLEIDDDFSREMRDAEKYIDAIMKGIAKKPRPPDI